MNRLSKEITLTGTGHGFSLVEMLIVLAIIAIIAGMMIGLGGGIFSGAQERATRSFIRSGLKPALLSYKLDMGSYPTTEEGIEALLKMPEGNSGRWNGPYIEEVPLDGWGRKYHYRSPGIRRTESYDFFSLGKDGRESDDDIGNWE